MQKKCSYNQPEHTELTETESVEGHTINATQFSYVSV